LIQCRDRSTIDRLDNVTHFHAGKFGWRVGIDLDHLDGFQIRGTYIGENDAEDQNSDENVEERTSSHDQQPFPGFGGSQPSFDFGVVFTLWFNEGAKGNPVETEQRPFVRE